MPSSLLPSTLLVCLLAVSGALSAALSAPARAQSPGLQSIKPSQADPRIRQYDEADLVGRPEKMEGAPLALFLPGTHGSPEHVRGLLSVVTGQGYRVIGLEYDDMPAVLQVCTKAPNQPECSARFREMRIWGTGGSRAVSNPVNESIVGRLVSLLKYLDRTYPQEHWGVYLTADGKPMWSKIVVSGLSQGAGMAAYIAKKEKVARVVCFSSPLDKLGARGAPLAPWLSSPSATPPERWYAERNAREPFNADLIRSYPALGIPPDHIKVFSLDLPPGANASNPMAYHGITVRDARYTPEWKFLYGTPAELK